MMVSMELSSVVNVLKDAKKVVDVEKVRRANVINDERVDGPRPVLLERECEDLT